MTDQPITAQPTDTRPVHERLSRREYEIFSRMAKGQTQKAIAHELDVSYKTVCTLYRRARLKTGLGSIAAIAVYAYVHGLVKMELP